MELVHVQGTSVYEIEEGQRHKGQEWVVQKSGRASEPEDQYLR